MINNKYNNFFNRLKYMVLTEPQKVAVKDKNNVYTYDDLWKKIQFFSQKLKNVGVRKGDRVAIFMENNANYVIGILAILTVGGIFVPLSTRSPEEYVYKILYNCNPSIVMVDNKSKEKFLSMPKKCTNIVNLDEIISEKSGEEVYENIIGGDIAYIVYTSGSTGFPKGVAIKWESLENYILDTVERLEFDQTSISLNMTSFCFDGSLTSVFCMLFCGGKLVIAPKFIMRVRQFANLLINEKITDLGCTPVQLSTLVDVLENEDVKEISIKTIAIGGESFSTEYIKRIFKAVKGIRILNRYGPTETTIVSASYEIREKDLYDNRPIPIGRPISNTIFYAVDENNNLIQPGEVGELYIGGVSVMSGYWSDTNLTNSVLNETLINGVKMYRTGDLVTIDDEGNYIFMSRKDDMVKINGYRIYLKEVDNAIVDINGVKDSCSIAVKRNGKTDIVSYVICDCDAMCEDGIQLKKKLLNILPAYMLPQKIFFVESFPVTTNGKVNRKELEKIASMS